jgi:AcrR family transcriptional regulator
MARAKATATRSAPATAEWQSYPDLSLHPILAAALSDFQQHGYHGTTVRAIASQAGLTMPSLYYHYGNKEGILFALLEVALDDIEAHVESCLDAADSTAQKFENFIMSVALHYMHRRDLAMLHQEFRFLDSDFRQKYVSRRRAIEQTLEDLLHAGIAEGLFEDDDPHFTTRVLLGMLGGILDWYRTDGSLTPAEIGDRYTRDALRLVARTA